jgi:3-isopropylmalate/(R)-2-methylmalate dehydratase small subunit
VKPVSKIAASAVCLLRDNIDTDAIIPSREIKSVSKIGLGPSLFAGWRYADSEKRKPDPDFALNL